MKKVVVGSKMPDFSLPNQEGELIKIADYVGKPLVVYFYPKNDTPGCTMEACGFRDQYEQFVSAGATVFGISTDSVDSHRRFKARYNLPFDLLSDRDGTVSKLFGVPTGFLGLMRSRITYIADQDGDVVHVFDSQLNFKKHVSESLKVITSLNADVSDDV